MSSLIFVFLLVSVIYSIDTGLHNGKVIKSEESIRMETIFSWCNDNTMCREKYYQNDVQNITLFKALVSNYIVTFPNTESLFYSMITNQTREESIKSLWTLYLLSNSKDNAMCDINHKPIFDKDTVSFRCQCIYGRSCSVVSTDSVLMRTAVIMGVISLLIIFFAIMSRTIVINRTFKSVTSKSQMKDALTLYQQ